MDKKESPQYVQTSLAGAMSMGLEKGRFLKGAGCTCLNLLLTYDTGCKASCSYCGLSHQRDECAAPTFIRVKWPTYELETIFQALDRHNPFKRACVSMITHPRAVTDTCTIISEVRSRTDLPVSGLLDPTVMRPDDMQAIKDAGADRVGIAIDAVTPELFERHRGHGVNGPHRWEKYWQAVEQAVQVFGRYRTGVHLIVGLGETEQEMIKVIDRAYQIGALTHLFSFFPEAGSRLENHAQPPLGQYRRVQMARYLINEGIITAQDITFGAHGEVKDFGIDIEPYAKQGLAFMTSGCPDATGRVACNRPFGNERASEPMRNYPYWPDENDIAVISPQLWDGVERVGRS